MRKRAASTATTTAANSECVIAPFFRAIVQSGVKAPATLTMQRAVSALRESARLNHEQLAKRLFITRAQVIQLESHGRPLTKKALERLEIVADDYMFFDLSRFFYKEKMDMEVRKRRRGSGVFH